MALTLDRTGIGDAVNIGSKSALNYHEAIKGAIIESIQCRSSSRLLKEMGYLGKEIRENNIFSMYDRFDYWSKIDRIKDLGFWINGNKSTDYSELTTKEVSLPDALQEITAHGYNVFIADITLPILKEYGFEALKIIIPEMHPLYLDERAKVLYSVHHGRIKEDKSLKPHPIT